ncbi:MAG TPA: response regulator transcription factor [Tepidisphaeraceae bacterium]|nr:response regulator transcription factor [Tepidisphaeraceae bacterium]
MRILVVEDSVQLSESIARGLRKSGYAVDIALDGPSGLWHAKSNVYDVIVLDVMLPGLDGFAVLKELRQSGCEAHTLFLTARDAVDDRVRGLRAGADDYLVKPFAFDELLARIEALVRRHHNIKSPILTHEWVTLNTASKVTTVMGEVVEMPPRQFALLEYLMLRRGTVVSRSEIETHLYDAQAEPMSNVVDAAIYALRKRIDMPGKPSLIQTRRGMGYIIAQGDEEREE